MKTIKISILDVFKKYKKELMLLALINFIMLTFLTSLNIYLSYGTTDLNKDLTLAGLTLVFVNLLFLDSLKRAMKKIGNVELFKISVNLSLFKSVVAFCVICFALICEAGNQTLENLVMWSTLAFFCLCLPDFFKSVEVNEVEKINE